MNKDFDYLFKFILVGESSIIYLIQVLERVACFSDFFNLVLKTSMNLHLELNLEPRSHTLMIEK